MAQQLQFAICRFVLASNQCGHQRLDGVVLFWAEMSKLLDFQVHIVLCLLVGFGLAKLFGDVLGPFARLLLGNATRHQRIKYFLAHALGARTQMPGQCRFKRLRSAPCTLLTLRRNAQAIGIPNQSRLGAASVVTVEVGGRVAGEQMELNETVHGDLSEYSMKGKRNLGSCWFSRPYLPAFSGHL